jgi:hypothetical protein
MRALLTTEAPARTLTLASSAALPPSHLSRTRALRVNLVRRMQLEPQLLNWFIQLNTQHTHQSNDSQTNCEPLEIEVCKLAKQVKRDQSNHFRFRL